MSNRKRFGGGRGLIISCRLRGTRRLRKALWGKIFLTCRQLLSSYVWVSRLTSTQKGGNRFRDSGLSFSVLRSNFSEGRLFFTGCLGDSIRSGFSNRYWTDLLCLSILFCINTERNSIPVPLPSYSRIPFLFSRPRLPFLFQENFSRRRSWLG